MKYLLPLLFVSTSLFAQTTCEDFLNLIGRTENSQEFKAFIEGCGPFDETAASDGLSKSLTSTEKGIALKMTNGQKDKSLTPEYQITEIELTCSTGSSGYQSKLPLGFEINMDPFAVRDHIKKHKELSYDRSEVGIRRSYTNYSGPVNDAVPDKEVRIYVSQYEKSFITIFRMTLR